MSQDVREVSWTLSASALALIAIALIVGANVFGASYFRPHATITPDSVGYMEVANNIAAGNGIRYDDGRFPAGQPVGYPLVVAVVQTLFGLETYWASKTVNVLMISAVIGMLAMVFRRRAHIYAAVFLTASMLQLSQMTWSEVPFICGLFFLAASLHLYHANGKARWIVCASLVSMFLFSTRYIGLFSLMPIGLAGLFYLNRKDGASFLRYLFAGLASLAFSVLYLMNNARLATHMTGVERAFSSDTNVDLLLALLKAQIFEFNIVRLGFGSESLWQAGLWWGAAAFLALAGGRLWSIWRATPNAASANAATTAWPWFLLVGSSYWLAIVGMRWVYFFDDFSFRLIGPSTPLFLIAIINFAERRANVSAALARFLMIAVVASVALNVPGKLAMNITHGKAVYPEVVEKYKHLAPNSVVLFGDPLAQHFRERIRIVEASALDPETNLEVIIDRACGRGVNEIHMEIKEYLLERPLHHDVKTFLRAHAGEGLVLITRCGVLDQDATGAH